MSDLALSRWCRAQHTSDRVVSGPRSSRDQEREAGMVIWTILPILVWTLTSTYRLAFHEIYAMWQDDRNGSSETITKLDNLDNLNLRLYASHYFFEWSLPRAIAKLSGERLRLCTYSSCTLFCFLCSWSFADVRRPYFGRLR
jgi:hypothetical protein